MIIIKALFANGTSRNIKLRDVDFINSVIGDDHSSPPTGIKVIGQHKSGQEGEIHIPYNKDEPEIPFSL